MNNFAHPRAATLDSSLQWPVPAWLLLCALAVAMTLPAQAQTFASLHDFTDGRDGNGPVVGLTADAVGNFYGITQLGGTGCGGSGCGLVFKLVRHGSSWILNPIYYFTGGADGGFPDSRVIFGPDGSLYGSTTFGGQFGHGTVYRLRPPLTICQRVSCEWRETTLYAFTGLSDGAAPEGDLVFDTAGNLYGTTAGGGGGTDTCSGGCGVVFQLSSARGTWAFSVVYSFTGLSDGAVPQSGVILDQSGNLYGTSTAGGAGLKGTVFELTKSGQTWTKTVLHAFQGGSDGQLPDGGVVFDAAGNLYGFTSSAGDHNNGTAFELQPSSGGWNYSVLSSFPGQRAVDPVSTPVLDSAGNLYGSAFSGGADGAGAIFELTYSGGSWNYVSLHDFVRSDGSAPLGSLLLDAAGNVYGTAASGGRFRAGVAFEIVR